MRSSSRFSSSSRTCSLVGKWKKKSAVRHPATGDTIAVVSCQPFRPAQTRQNSAQQPFTAWSGLRSAIAVADGFELFTSRLRHRRLHLTVVHFGTVPRTTCKRLTQLVFREPQPIGNPLRQFSSRRAFGANSGAIRPGPFHSSPFHSFGRSRWRPLHSPSWNPCSIPESGPFH